MEVVFGGGSIDNGCVSRSAVVRGEVGSSRGVVVVLFSSDSGSETVLYFCMSARTGGGGLLAVAEDKREVGEIYNKVKIIEDKV